MDRRQAALFDLRQHGARRQDADAGSESHRLLDHLDVVELHRQYPDLAAVARITRHGG